METDFPLPGNAMDVAGFVAALHNVKVWAGNPSLEELRRRTGVASSTLSDAFSSRRRRIPSLDIVRAVIRACGGGPPDVVAWERAWRALAERIDAGKTTDPTSGIGTGKVAVPRQLPPDVAGFTGRRQSMEALRATHPRTPATIIAGTAGVGKTTLAVHWAHHIADRYPDGQLYLDLRGHSSDQTISPVEALSLLLQSLGVPAEKVPAELSLQTGLYRSLLADRRVLVILDNVVDTAHVRPLLPGGAGCHALITSRNALTGLVVRESAARITLETLDAAESVELLIRQLGRARVEAEPGTAIELATLCAHLPLALRIVAANLAARPRQSIAGAVQDLHKTDLLGRLQVIGDPEIAVTAAFDVSYRALPGETQRLFRLIGLVPGPEISRETAAVLLDRDLDDPVPELDELLAAHLIAEATPNRFRSHDLLALYARRQAGAEPDDVREKALDRLFSWYLLSSEAAVEILIPAAWWQQKHADLVCIGEAHRFSGPPEAQAWLRTELANLTAAASHAAQHGPAPFAWYLAHTLAGFLYSRGDTVALLSVARAGLRAAESVDNAFGRANGHMTMSLANTQLRDLRAAAKDLAAAREQYRRADDPRSALAASNNLGDLLVRLGEIDWAEQLLEKIIADPRVQQWVGGNEYSNLAMTRRIRGDYTDAQRLEKIGQQLAIRDGNLRLAAPAKVGLAMTHLELGEPAAAEPLLRSAYATVRETSSDIDLYDTVAGLLLVCARTGRHDEAADWAADLEALLERGICSYSGDDWAHTALVEAHLAAGRPEEALAIGEPALTENERAGYRLPAMRLRIRLGRAQVKLGNSTAARAFWDEALGYAKEQNLPDGIRIESELSALTAGSG
ncbi:tetratricopeptide repeat protein [Winogradskya consettensis]|uniref:NB-ARC domain-containing protein n=1 Tax=Winogradskya consettensis TaxID=113560 RepID=A0A919W0T0_9ACTN|nr:NB-ARC domain-containing protein [Actinoplanes consettensis]GIM82244.1 hypothetical protein Aco04nite_80610 [Actinoplanes consettensis]